MGFLLHHSIDEAAERDPGRDAFRFEGEAISYADLAHRSNQLAHLLIAEGVTPHDRVGIYMNKSLELPVAIYGVLKAGAAYVPIDPTAPATRVAFVLEDCGVRHLVTNASRWRKAARVAAETPNLRCVVGAKEAGTAGATNLFPWSTLETAPSRSPLIRLVEDDLAYIMYTSGSTGLPKGLMHTHASGLSYARLSAREYDVQPEDRLGNHSPLHFDMSTFEYLTAPYCGATTVIIPEETTMFPVSLAELIERERLTFWYSVPLALIQLLERGEIEKRDMTSLRWVIFGGEPFPPKHLARLAGLWPNARFSNSYGPAEVNQCTAYHVPVDDLDTDAPIPLGHVWPGAEGLVVDETDHAVVSGEPGELLIRTPTMMRGYWARPDLNEKAFFRRQGLPGYEEVFYRTGDLVREREDGTMLFLGRRDRQIKVRGYRVELEGVEAVLSSLPGIVESAAVDVRDDVGNIEIVAVVLTSNETATDAETLRRLAAKRLASYALPSHIEVRTSLPRTGSGKADREKLRSEFERGHLS